MYVGMYVCMYVCMYVWTYVRTGSLGATDGERELAKGREKKRRRTHTDQSSLLVQSDRLSFKDTLALNGIDNNRAQGIIKRVRKPNVPHDAVLKVSPGPHALGPIDDLVRDQEIPWLDLLAETADGAEGHNASDAEFA